MPATITRDAQGRIWKYSFKSAPSLGRVRQILRQAEKQGATRAGIIAQVGQFQGYEMGEAEGRTIRDFRSRGTAASPSGLLGRLKGQGSNPSEYAIIQELKGATGADVVRDLRMTTISFSY